MKPKTKRHTDPALAQARRDQVLCAAADCFRRKGYHGAGMAEISKTAGMSAGHIYNYFASKEAIIESIVERDMQEMFSVFQQFEEMPGDRLTNLLDGIGNGVDRHTDVNQGALDLEMLAEAARNEKVALLLCEADKHSRMKLRNLLLGEKGILNEASSIEIDARIEVIFAVMGGLILRKTLNPEITKETLLIALKPAMRTLLTPF